jgi:nicotianamine synthase
MGKACSESGNQINTPWALHSFGCGDAHFYTMNIAQTSYTALQKKIIDIYEALSLHQDLTPREEINNLFSSLVDIVISTPKDLSAQLLSTPEIQTIQQDLLSICSKGEYELELAYAKKIRESHVPYETLAEFPYIENYKNLTAMEVEHLQPHTSDAHRILFIGGGPLPLSAILMAQIHNIQVDILDKDETACSASKDVLQALGLEDQIRVIHGDISHTKTLETYTTVILAALVGESQQEKDKILQHIAEHTHKGTCLMLRSVQDLGKLLYPEVILNNDAVTIVDFVHPKKDVINPILICTTK